MLFFSHLIDKPSFLAFAIALAVSNYPPPLLSPSSPSHPPLPPLLYVFILISTTLHTRKKLFVMSMTGFSGSDDLLACFAAGNAFSWDDWFRHETEEAHFQEVIDMMLNLAIFVYIGAIIVSL